MPKYAFRACRINDNSVDAVVSGPCYACGNALSVTVRSADLEKFRAGNFAQDCFPYLSPSEREFLISGICDPCWDEMFPDESDEEEPTSPQE